MAFWSTKAAIIVYYATEAAYTDIYRVQTYIKSIKHT